MARKLFTVVMLFLYLTGMFLIGAAISVAVRDAKAHEGMDAVSRFYAGWMRPDLGRVSSCCNNEDCRAVPTRRIAGAWQFQTAGQWWDIPEKVLEHNYEDAKDSPDGQSHVCFHFYEEAQIMYVFCAVLGSGS